MNNDPVFHRLCEPGWRRSLTEAERAELKAWLAAHPEARGELEIETALNRALARLPDAPVPSNFTTRVLQAVERDTARAPHKADWVWAWRVFFPRAAVATCVIVGAGLFANHRFVVWQRESTARSIKIVATTPSLPGPDILANFDTIRRLEMTGTADNELLVALQ